MVELLLALEKKQKKVVQQHREKVKTSFEESLFFISHSFPLCTIIKKIPFTCLSYKFHMIGSGAAYQVEERYQIKALPSRQGSLPLTFQENPFFSLYPLPPPPLLEKGDITCVYPAPPPQQDARWQMSGRSNKSACSDFFHSRLAFITLTLSESPSEQQLAFC